MRENMTGFHLFLLVLTSLFALIGSWSLRDDRHASLFDVFALDRYKWYGELKADVRTALRQLGRDRDRLFRFVGSNVAWVVATATGMIGLFLTALMMIGFIPTSMKTAVAETLQADRTTTQAVGADLIETRTSIPDYVFAANDPSVAMEVKGLVFRPETPQTPFDEPQRVIVPVGVEEIQAREPVDFRRRVRIFDRFSREPPAEIADDNQELLVVAQPAAAAGNRLPPKQFDLMDEVITGEVRRQNNRIQALVAGLHVEKIYPESIAPGKPVHYEIILQNTTDETIGRVRVEETIPEQASLLNTVPQAERSDSDGRNIWIVDRLEPDETQTIHVELDAHELDSVRTNTRVLVRVAYSDSSDVVVDKRAITPQTDPASRSLSVPQTGPAVVRSRRKTAAQPPESKAETVGRVRIEITGPKRARVGDDISLMFRIYNYGTEPIDNASIRVRLDPAIRGEGGDVWRVQIQPVLEPGQSRVATFRGKAMTVGTAVNRIEVFFGKKVVQSGNRRLEIVADDRE
jgi:hypothetical protein